MNRLREIRLSKNLSLKQAGVLCDVSPTTIMRIENHEMIPSQLLMIRISKGLGLRVSEIFYLGDDISG